MRRCVLFLLVLSLVGAGCGDDSSQTPTSPSGPSSFTENFTGTIKTSGSAFYSFTAIGTNVAVTLASLTSTATGAVVAATPKIGLGIPAGTGCGLSTSLNAGPALSAQIVTTLAPGTYCVSITDTGGITADSDFVIRITQGSLSLASTTSPEPFNSNLAVKGSSTRTFTVAGGTGTGLLTATLNSVSPAKVIGVGAGLWRFDTATCAVTQVVNSSGGAQISMPIDQGTYCIKVFDTGTLTDFVAFSINLIHP